MLLLDDAQSAASSGAVALRCSTWGSGKVWLIPECAGGLWLQHSVRRNLLQTIQIKASATAKLQKGGGHKKSSSDTYGYLRVSFLFSNLKGPNSQLSSQLRCSIPCIISVALHRTAPANPYPSCIAVCTVISGCCFAETHKVRTRMPGGGRPLSCCNHGVWPCNG